MDIKKCIKKKFVIEIEAENKEFIKTHINLLKAHLGRTSIPPVKIKIEKTNFRQCEGR